MAQSIAYLTASHFQSTLNEHSNLIDEFRILQPIFLEHNANLIRVNWRDPSIDWQAFSTIVPIACWDYTEYPNEFSIFINKISQLPIKIKNDAKIILWNMRKNYLLDLQNLNLPVAELLLIPQHSDADISAITNQLHHAHFKSKTIIAKPSIGNGAAQIIRFDMNDIHLYQKIFENILSHADLILQPYHSEITEVGEYSYLFFNNQFTHAVLKKPAHGDFRSQPLFGANVSAYQPNTKEIEQASQFIPSQCAYARVDVFKRRNQLFLMELELIEPYLYLEYAPETAKQAFCRALLMNNYGIINFNFIV